VTAGVTALAACCKKHPANDDNRARADQQTAKVQKPLTKRGFFAPLSLD